MGKKMNPALLVLDPQNDFFGEDNPNLTEFQLALMQINAAIAIFRKQKRLIVFVQHVSANKLEGSEAWQIYKDIDYRPDDVCFSKRQPNAFWQTGLDDYLTSMEIDTVVIAGFIAEFCVLSTYRGAQERGYHGLILQNGIASLVKDRTQFIMAITENISLTQL